MMQPLLRCITMKALRFCSPENIIHTDVPLYSPLCMCVYIYAPATPYIYLDSGPLWTGGGREETSLVQNEVCFNI